LIEPDVLLNFRDLNIFFKNIIGNIACDFLAPNFGPSSKNWFWYRYAENISSSVYQCNFPLTLISSEAIEYLLQSRQDITATLRDGHNEVLYPNDESFVATTLMKGGFQCLSFNNVAPSNFSYFSTAFPMMYEDVINCRHLEGQVLHPVILKEDFWSVADMKASNFKLLNNQAISFIENIIISSGLTHSDIIEDVLCKYFLRDVRRLIEEKNKTRI
jgi:hypothetical protein